MPGNVKYAIDASIVRIMKHRKVLTYDELVAECIRQLRNLYKVHLECNFIFSLFWICFAVSLLKYYLSCDAAHSFRHR